MIYYYSILLVILADLILTLNFRGKILMWLLILIRFVLILGLLLTGAVIVGFTPYEWIFVLGLMNLNILIARYIFHRRDKWYLLFALVVAPIAEELLFRGVLMERLSSVYSAQIMISSALFGIYHVKNAFRLSPFALFYQILYAAFVVGPLFAFIKITTGSILFCIAAHSLNNLIAETLTRKYFPQIMKES